MRPPRVIITNKLGSYAAAKREIMPGVEHRQHKGLSNRAENSHQPTRRRERIMKHYPRGTLRDFFQPMARSTISFFAHQNISSQSSLPAHHGFPGLGGRCVRHRRRVKQSCNRAPRVLISFS